MLTVDLNQLFQRQRWSLDALVQYAVGVTLYKKCFRELVVALEWSDNETSAGRDLQMCGGTFQAGHAGRVC